MRLNRVELFYVLVAAIGSERAATRGHDRLRPASRVDRQRPALPLAGQRRWSQGWPPLGRATADRKGQAPPAQGQRRRRGMKEALARGSRAWPRPAPLQWRPVAAKAPCRGAAGCRQAPCKGRPPAVAAASRARTIAASGEAARACCPRRDHKGQPRGQGCRLQGPLLPGATASKGSARAMRRPQHARCRPKAVAPAAGATGHADGVQRRHLRRAAAAAEVQMGARRGLGHPFK
ncbi:hypothetical protein GW17_00035471 [Ensete ventricosum]|nr:hypothetical protein GW17_00035471 [Ensete ventricosum]